MHRFTNRLINERSPYLLQHAHNPVDWWPWGSEAFQQARQLDKPIFLSVGYSTCHWCHVMERESFENEQIAQEMNRYFINIKVDRETLPNVDRAYMAFLLATNGGGGGWPMSVWMTPDLKPFFAGTYFPPQDSYGRPGFVTVCKALGVRWLSDKSSIADQAEELISKLRNAYSAPADPLQRIPPLSSQCQKAVDYVAKRFDVLHGGFGGAPKFPTVPQLNFLLNNHYATGEPTSCLSMAAHTLHRIAQGGIHDHLAGGFHRYSVDRLWRVPHFEKMLYDQAQLLAVYSDAYRSITTAAQSRDDYAELAKEFSSVAHGIVEYVERDLLSKPYSSSGDNQPNIRAFYAAEDADSVPLASTNQAMPPKEGAFAVWTWREVDEIIAGLMNDEESAPAVDCMELFAYRYGLEPGGNCDTTGHSAAADDELAGKNVLFEQHSIEETAKHFSLPVPRIADYLTRIKTALWNERRLRRPRPHLDDKIVTGWNGLMIGGLAKAAQSFRLERAYQMACGAAEFIRKHLTDGTHLIRSYRNGPMLDAHASAEDYAFLIQGLLELYHCRLDERWLEWAACLQSEQNELFWDPHDGGYFSASTLEPNVVLRIKDDQDGAEPSSNSISLCNLVRLSVLLDDKSYLERAKQLLCAQHNNHFMQHPYAMPQMLVGLHLYHNPPKQVVICGDLASDSAQQMLRVIHERFLPDVVVLNASKDRRGGFLAGRNASYRTTIESISEGEDAIKAHICQGSVCGVPVTSAADLCRQLNA